MIAETAGRGALARDDVLHPGVMSRATATSAVRLAGEADGVVEENLLSSSLDDQWRQARLPE